MFEFSKLAFGDPSRPPLIFLHGFLGSKEDWKAMIPFFEKKFFCSAIDLPGHGSTPYFDPILLRLKKAVQQTFPIKPIFVGYSMGGRIALQLQECAAAIVAISAHPGLTSKKEKEERWQSDTAWSKKLLTLPLDTFLDEWYAQPVFQSLQGKPALLSMVIKQRMKQNPQDLARVLLQLTLAHQPRLRQLHCPMLFLHGEQDLKYRELYCRLPKTASVRTIKNSGHNIPFENASHCATEIINWLP